jgi:hypothetical protein
MHIWQSKTFTSSYCRRQFLTGSPPLALLPPAGFIMFSVFAVISVILFVRQGSTSTSVITSIATIVMILVTIGTWKRMAVAPLAGLAVASVAIAWEISQGKIAAIVLIVPLMGGFWTAARGIAVLKQLRRQGTIQATPE